MRLNIENPKVALLSIVPIGFLHCTPREEKGQQESKGKEDRNFLANLPVSADDIFVAGELSQTHGATGVELLGGDAHLAA